MKKAATIFVLLLLAASLQAQISFRTVVPKQPIVAGESFQVQYIVEDGERSLSIKPPSFNHFRFVAGPNVYRGSVSTVGGPRQVHNAVYTLEAIRAGRFMIPGATIIVNGEQVRSNDVLVQVISREDAGKRFNRENGTGPSDYFLRPGEDPYEKIRQNLFIKVMVNKRTCFVGEPVLATFKLYSRLESRSDIVKNPGFYGFTVFDMVNLADKQVETENVNGKTFDVHTIRKVQLYPLQPGAFTIDAMQVKNKVEFSRSAVNKKTEQEIIEGVLGSESDGMSPEGTDVFEMDINTEPVSINVRPLPEKNKPDSFTGAAGHFSIAAVLANNELAKNEEGFLEIIITGKGNFIQLEAPSVQWPAGVEGFDPVVKDDLDKTKLPLTGRRIFRYPFVCASPGNWKLPAIQFSFFDTDSNTYTTVSTQPVGVMVSNKGKKTPVVEGKKVSIAEKSERAARIAGVVVVLIVLVIVAYWVFRKKETPPLPVKEELSRPSIADLLDTARAAIDKGDNSFYSILHHTTWKYVAEHFDLSGSEMNKLVLAVKMKAADMGEDITERLFRIFEHCEAGMYTSASLSFNRQDILAESTAILEYIEAKKDSQTLL